MSANSSEQSGGGDTPPASTLPPGIIRGSKNRNKSKKSSSNLSNNHTSTNDLHKLKSFKGVTEEIGAVLCLGNEDVELGKEGFPKFQNKLEEYVLREYDNAKDITPLIVTLHDPIKPFMRKNFPKAKYTAEEMEKDAIKKKIVENTVNAYTNRLTDLEQNIVSLYGHVWGQCTPAMQAEIKADPKYNVKRVEYDALWLLITAKKLIASVDKKGNKYLNAYKILADFNRTYQKQDESEQAWLSRYQVAIETLSLAGCDHIFLVEHYVAISLVKSPQSWDFPVFYLTIPNPHTNHCINCVN